MTKREQYELQFYKTKMSESYTGNICLSNMIGPYSYLQVLNRLSVEETTDLISYINNALNGKYYEPYYTSDGTEAEDIELAYPNIIINGNTIAMQDMLTLLQEWQEFITS